jgi:hypothetical protein
MTHQDVAPFALKPIIDLFQIFKQFIGGKSTSIHISGLGALTTPVGIKADDAEVPGEGGEEVRELPPGSHGWEEAREGGNG